MVGGELLKSGQQALTQRRIFRSCL
uniref:Uncharacterized protein n=1 Tax=Arundo donax TaxID=35708 RepID=A0A0A9C4E6_ARUDO